MFLIFRLGRPDVLPIHDLGVRKGWSVTYGKRHMPSPRELLAFGERWRPYRTVASWVHVGALSNALSYAATNQNSPAKAQASQIPPGKIETRQVHEERRRKRENAPLGK